jgi:hypothetical protein
MICCGGGEQEQRSPVSGMYMEGRSPHAQHIVERVREVGNGRILLVIVWNKCEQQGGRSGWWGECWSHSEAASGNVESHLGRFVVYVQAHSIVVQMVHRSHEATSGA